MRNCPLFLQRGHPPGLFLPHQLHESAATLMDIQQVPTSFPSGNYAEDFVPSDMMVRNDPSGSSTASGVRDASISHTPGAYSKDHVIPSPLLEPVTRRTFSQRVSAPMLMPVPESSSPASTAFQNDSTTGVPTFPVALTLTQNQNSAFNQMHIPQALSPEPVTFFTSPAREPDGPLSLHTRPTDEQLLSSLPPNRSDTLNTEATDRTFVSNTDDVLTMKEVLNQPGVVIGEAPLKTETTSGGITANPGPLKPKRKRCAFVSWIVKRF